MPVLVGGDTGGVQEQQRCGDRERDADRARPAVRPEPIVAGQASAVGQGAAHVAERLMRLAALRRRDEPVRVDERVQRIRRAVRRLPLASGGGRLSGRPRRCHVPWGLAGHRSVGRSGGLRGGRRGRPGCGHHRGGGALGPDALGPAARPVELDGPVSEIVIAQPGQRLVQETAFEAPLTRAVLDDDELAGAVRGHLPCDRAESAAHLVASGRRRDCGPWVLVPLLLVVSDWLGSARNSSTRRSSVTLALPCSGSVVTYSTVRR